MPFNNPDGPRSEARDAAKVSRDNRTNAYRELIWTLLNRGRPYPEDHKLPCYPLSEMAKMVAVRGPMGRTTAYLYIEEAYCEDPSSPAISVPDPNPPPHVPEDKALLILFNPAHPDYKKWVKEWRDKREPPKPPEPKQARKGRANA